MITAGASAEACRDVTGTNPLLVTCFLNGRPNRTHWKYGYWKISSQDPVPITTAIDGLSG